MNDLYEQVTGHRSMAKSGDTLFAELRDHRRMLAEQIKVAWRIMDGVDQALIALAHDPSEEPIPTREATLTREPTAEPEPKRKPKPGRPSVKETPSAFVAGGTDAISAVMGRLGAEPRGAWASSKVVLDNALPRRMSATRRAALIDQMVQLRKIERTTMQDIEFIRVPEA